MQNQEAAKISNDLGDVNKRDNAVKELKNHLSKDDYFRLADENKHDNINQDDFNDVGDFYCSTKSEYDKFADKNRFDRFTDDNYYQLRGFRNKQIYENYAPEYYWSRASSQPNQRDSLIRGWRLDNYGGAASWYR